jgi:hypothetical protein
VFCIVFVGIVVGEATKLDWTRHGVAWPALFLGFMSRRFGGSVYTGLVACWLNV